MLNLDVSFLSLDIGRDINYDIYSFNHHTSLSHIGIQAMYLLNVILDVVIIICLPFVLQDTLYIRLSVVITVSPFTHTCPFLPAIHTCDCSTIISIVPLFLWCTSQFSEVKS